MTFTTPVFIAQRRLTRRFVLIAPVIIRMEGMVTVESMSGAKARARTSLPRPPITVTLCEPSDSGYRQPVADESGSRLALDFELVAEWGTDVREGDEFDQGGHRYRVDVLMIDNGYETRALVTRVD